jgi:hypothetical protein
MAESNEHAEVIRLAIEAGDFSGALSAIQSFGERLRQDANQTRSTGEEYDAAAQLRAHQNIVDQAVKGLSNLGSDIDITGITRAFSSAFERLTVQIEQDLARITEALGQGYKRSETARGERFFRGGRPIKNAEGREVFGIASDESLNFQEESRQVAAVLRRSQQQQRQRGQGRNGAIDPIREELVGEYRYEGQLNVPQPQQGQPKAQQQKKRQAEAAAKQQASDAAAAAPPPTEKYSALQSLAEEAARASEAPAENPALANQRLLRRYNIDHPGSGTVRLFRGEDTSTRDQGGTFFTPDENYARNFMGREGGRLLSVEVPQAIARAAEEAAKSAGHVGMDLPRPWAESAYERNPVYGPPRTAAGGAGAGGEPPLPPGAAGDAEDAGNEFNDLLRNFYNSLIRNAMEAANVVEESRRALGPGVVPIAALGPGPRPPTRPTSPFVRLNGGIPMPRSPLEEFLSSRGFIGGGGEPLALGPGDYTRDISGVLRNRGAIPLGGVGSTYVPPPPPPNPYGPDLAAALAGEQPEFASAEAIAQAARNQRVREEAAGARQSQVFNTRSEEEKDTIAAGAASRLTEQADIQQRTFSQLPPGLAGFNARRLRTLQDQASQYGIAGAEQMPEAHLRYRVQQYTRLQSLTGASNEELRGLNFSEVQQAMRELAAQSRALARQEERFGSTLQEHPSTFKEGLGAAVAGIGGFRSATRLPVGALAGNAVGALARGAIGGASFNAFFALQNGFTNSIAQAVQLDKSLAGLQATVSDFGTTGASNFSQVRDSILSISEATGVTGTDVVDLAENFLGLTGNMNAATSAAKGAAQFIEITGANAQQTGQQMASVQQLFGASTNQQTNAAVAAANAAGRGTPTGIAGVQAGVAALAPLGKEYGFGLNQLYGLLSVASRGSALDSGTIGNELNKVLLNLQPKIPQLASYGINFSNPTNLQTDLRDLLTQLPKLSPQERIGAQKAIGSPFDIQALAALFSTTPQQLDQALGTNYLGSHQGDQRVRTVSQSAAVTLERLRTAATNLGEELISSGIGSFFIRVASDGASLIGFIGHFSQYLGVANSALHDMPVRIAELLAVLGAANRFGFLGNAVSHLPGSDTRAGRIIFGQTPAQRNSESAQGRNTAALNQSTTALGGLADAAKTAAGALTDGAAAATADTAATEKKILITTADGTVTAEHTVVMEGDTAATEANAGSRFTGLKGGASLVGIFGGQLLAGQAGNRSGIVANSERTAGDTATGAGIGYQLGGVPGALVGGTLGAGYSLYSNLADRPVHELPPIQSNRFGVPLDSHGNPIYTNYAQTRTVLNPATGQPMPPVPVHNLGTDHYAKQQEAYIKSHQAEFDAVGRLIQRQNPGAYKQYEFDLQHAGNLNTYNQALQYYSTYGQTQAGQQAIGSTPQGAAAQARHRQAIAAQQAALASGLAPGSIMGVAAPTVAPDIGTVQQEFQAGALSWNGALDQMRKVIDNTVDPVQKFANALQAAAVISQQAGQAIQNIVTFGQELGGFSPAQALQAQNQAFIARASSMNPHPQDIVAQAQQAASLGQQYIQNQLQNQPFGATPGASLLSFLQAGTTGAGVGIPGISPQAAAKYNAALAQQEMPMEFQNGQGQFITQSMVDQAIQNSGAVQNAQAQLTAAQRARFFAQNSVTADQQQVQTDRGALNAMSHDRSISPQDRSAAEQQLKQDQANLAQQQQQLQQAQLGQFYAQNTYNQANSQANTALTAGQLGGNVGGVVAQLSPTEIAQGYAQYAQEQQAIAGAQLAQAQSTGASAQSLGQMKAASDQKILATLQQAQAQAQASGKDSAALDAQVANASQTVYQDLYANTQTTLQNVQSYGQYLQTLDSQDPAKAAQDAINAANQGAAALGTSIAALQATPWNQLSANQQSILLQYAQATQQAFTAAQQNIQALAAVAQSQAAITGNAPAGALSQLNAAQQQLQNFEATYPQLANSSNSTFNNLVAAVNNAKANYLTTTISFTESILQEEVGNNQISIGQAINQLKALQVKAAQAGNFAQVEQIQSAIQQYINQGNQNAQFNLPSGLNLPTLYEVRRTEGTPVGGNYYGNQGKVNVQINIGSNADVQPAVNTIMQAVGGSPTTGANLPVF